jgi:hypothetical protein
VLALPRRPLPGRDDRLRHLNPVLRLLARTPRPADRAATPPPATNRGPEGRGRERGQARLGLVGPRPPRRRAAPGLGGPRPAPPRRRRARDDGSQRHVRVPGRGHIPGATAREDAHVRPPSLHVRHAQAGARQQQALPRATPRRGRHGAVVPGGGGTVKNAGDDAVERPPRVRLRRAGRRRRRRRPRLRQGSQPAPRSQPRRRGYPVHLLPPLHRRRSGGRLAPGRHVGAACLPVPCAPCSRRAAAPRDAGRRWRGPHPIGGDLHAPSSSSPDDDDEEGEGAHLRVHHGPRRGQVPPGVGGVPRGSGRGPLPRLRQRERGRPGG